MKAIALNEVEFGALAGLPHLQFRLYLVLRWYMDARTGLVGSVRGISRQSLAEELYVEPVPGRRADAAGSPSVKAVRCALDGLARAGLLVSRGSGEVLVFLMPMASRVSARAKEQGPGRGRVEGPEHGPGSGGANAGESGRQGPEQGPGLSAEQGPTSRVKVDSFSVDKDLDSHHTGLRSSEAACAALGGGVDADEQRDVPLQPGEWLVWFNRVHGTSFDQSSRFDRNGLWPVFTRWCEAGVSVVLVDQAVAYSRRTAKGPIASLPKYVDRVLADGFCLQEGAGVAGGASGSGLARGAGRGAKFDPVAFVNRNRSQGGRDEQFVDSTAERVA